jgi:hypothetical protein
MGSVGSVRRPSLGRTGTGKTRRFRPFVEPASGARGRPEADLRRHYLYASFKGAQLPRVVAFDRIDLVLAQRSDRPQNAACCVTHSAKATTLAFLQTLDGYRLADLLAPAGQLVASLGLGLELEPAE